MIGRLRSRTGTLILSMSCVLLVGAMGCLKGPDIPKGTVKKAPVFGTIMMGGKPLADAEVYFVTEKFTGFGKTNADGQYTLAQGAAIGMNKVYISKLEGGSKAVQNDPTLALNDPAQTEIANQSVGGGKKGPKQLVPPEFSDEKTTKLTFEVPEGGAKDADFLL